MLSTNKSFYWKREVVSLPIGLTEHLTLLPCKSTIDKVPRLQLQYNYEKNNYFLLYSLSQFQPRSC